MGQIFQILLFSISLLTVSQFKQNQEEESFKIGDSFSAKVVEVNQGDLITAELDNELISIRLAEIDSPDPSQVFSRQARQFTKDLALDQTVKINVGFVDLYQRVIAVVILPDGRVLNEEIVRLGFAWHYKVSLKPNPILEQLEYQAWNKRLGFWIDEFSIPPWKFRAESSIPDPPPTLNRVNYDRIFEYGLFGNKKTSIFIWPACKSYHLPKIIDRIIFSNKLQAKNLGYKPHKACQK